MDAASPFRPGPCITLATTTTAGDDWGDDWRENCPVDVLDLQNTYEWVMMVKYMWAQICMCQISMPNKGLVLCMCVCARVRAHACICVCELGGGGGCGCAGVTG